MKRVFEHDDDLTSDDICIYTRVSTSRQIEDSKFGLEKQYESIIQYVNQNFTGFTADHCRYFEDIGTMYKNKNVLKNFNKMEKHIKSKHGRKTLIIIYSICRLGRNLYKNIMFLSKLKQYNCKIISIKENIMYNKTRMMNNKFHYFLVRAEEESDLKSLNMTTRHNIIKRMGGHVGFVPYGFKLEKIGNIPKLVPDKDEQTVIKTIKKLRDEHKTDKDIERIISRKFKNKRGKPWSINNIRSINLNRINRTKLNGLSSSMNKLKI